MMASKEKDNKSVQEKIKQLFRRHKGDFATSIKSRDEFKFSEEFQRELSKDTPLQRRLKAIIELNDALTASKLDEKTIGKVIGLVQDLLNDPVTDVRHIILQCLQCVVTGQSARLGLLRALIFRFIVEHKHPEDLLQRFELLHTLTENGKNVVHYEEMIGPFLLDWFPEIAKAGKTEHFLQLLVNCLKFNGAYINEEVITGFVHYISELCCITSQDEIVRTCLQFLDTIIAYYRNLPADSLPQFLCAMCRVVNNEEYCATSWKIMRNLLGTHMGHSAIFTMCRILQDQNLKDDKLLMRGAIFYINMALWSPQPLTNLRCPPSSVLPSLLRAANYNQPLVTFEIILSLEKLVEKFGKDLQDPTWETVLHIISVVIKQLENDARTKNTDMSSHLHDTLTYVENLVDQGMYNGSASKFYRTIQECSADRPEKSVLRLVAHLAEEIHPHKNMWFKNLNELLHAYFKYDSEKRTNIRLKALAVLGNVVELNRLLYEDELVDKIVIPHLIHLANDYDTKIRSAGAALLIDLCLLCNTKKCLEMLDILERLLNRPFDVYVHDNVAASETDTADVKTVVDGLVRVFVLKIHKLPSLHAVRIYKMLVNHLELHYQRPKIFENCKYVRVKIFECFLKMRADSLYRLGCPDANGILKFSPYLLVTYRYTDRGPLASPPPTSPAVMQQTQCTETYVSMRAGFKIFITCLNLERDKEVLQKVLNQLPDALENKSLILSKHGNTDIGLLVDTICTVINNYKSETLPSSRNRSDFWAAMLVVLPSLASYHRYLDPTHQQKMIRQLCSFKFGLGHPCSKQCITALTTCTLEMQDAMKKMLPEVLLILSKSSATVHIANPVLEFLSTLTILPSVYSSFVPDQYMAIFAILLPYTNPSKYNHYTVSLAHHVIAVWFLKCRLPLRKDFVKYITNGLGTYAAIPLEETMHVLPKQDVNKLNQDSSDRKRSSSLTEQRSLRRERTATVGRLEGRLELKSPIIDKSLIPLYSELTETCIDLMARYTFSPCSALPRRLPNSDFLLSGGQSMSWLLGNRVITITTSGCAQKVLKHGLCDKCHSLCKTDNSKSDSSLFRSSRSGSNDKDDSSQITRQNSGSYNNTSASSPVDAEVKKLPEKLEQLSGKLQQLEIYNKTEKRCACWCQGWAEIYVRRPTGDMSWAMRIQNQTSHQHSIYDFPLNELSTLLMPSLGERKSSYQSTSIEDDRYSGQDDCSNASVPINIPDSPNRPSPSRQNSRDSLEDELKYSYDDGCRSRNPVRRSNSSPEMSSKHPFMLQKQMERDEFTQQEPPEEVMKKCNKNFSKVSCEAIPEEIAGMGTTPPSNDSLESSGTHPCLLSSLSCPGPPNPNESMPVSKPYQTVPVSPNILHSGQQLPLTQHNIRQAQSNLSLKFEKSERSVDRPNNLPSLNIMMPLSSKPPQSPTQTSPRLSRHGIKDREGNELQKSSSLVLEKSQLMRQKDKKSSSIEAVFSQADQSMGSQKRDRGYTISVMSPVRKPRSESLRPMSNRGKEAPRSGINPSFIFLQLFHSAQFGSTGEKPLLITNNDIVQRALKVLDCIPPYETHKIGVIYVGRSQSNKETDILRNKYGSVRYVEFLQKLGTLIKLADVDPQVFFLGGLEQTGGDGKFAYIWQDDVIRVMFHVATMMPNKETDPNCNNKKTHIGNNNVTIVYNESGEDFNINTIKGQFNFASIIIQPLDHNSNKVTVKVKEDLIDLIGTNEPKIVSDQNVAILARQLALHANLGSLVFNSLKNTSGPYASNWLERLRKIKNLQKKILQDTKRDHLGNHPDDYSSKTGRFKIEDFTEYT